MTDGPTTLFDALRVLAECHTRDSDGIGFTIHSSVAPWEFAPHPWAHYNKAWEIVREQLHMPVSLKEVNGEDE